MVVLRLFGFERFGLGVKVDDLEMREELMEKEGMEMGMGD